MTRPASPASLPRSLGVTGGGFVINDNINGEAWRCQVLYGIIVQRHTTESGTLACWVQTVLALLMTLLTVLTL